MPHTVGHIDDNTPAISWAVFTRDGNKIGTVEELRRGVFKVDAPMQPDFWFSTNHVASNTSTRVMLVFDKDQLGYYRLDDPEDALDAGRSQMTNACTGRGWWPR